MKLIIKGDPKEIADLIKELQDRQIAIKVDKFEVSKFVQKAIDDTRT